MFAHFAACYFQEYMLNKTGRDKSYAVPDPVRYGSQIVVWPFPRRGIVPAREGLMGKDNKRGFVVQQQGGEGMTEIKISDGRVCIIKVMKLEAIRDGLETMKTTLLDFITSNKRRESDLDTYLFVDLTRFNIINSSLIGILGSIIMDRNIRLLCLCNLQPAVADILKRFGVIDESGGGKEFPGDPDQEHVNKVLVFDSLEAGLACLIPS